MTKTLVIDLDGTLTVPGGAKSYADALPREDVASRVREYSDKGFKIAIFTSRNMRTFGNSVGKITANTVPVIVDWLRVNEIPFDELHIGKPWCGHGGFYVDDRAIRPSEFANLSHAQINRLLKRE